jgi:hypothetical protein
MAKTTRKTESTTAAAKPAARRKTNGVPAADSLKAAPRRRAKAATAKAARPAGTAPRPEPTHEEIAVRAYHLYLSRRGWPGSPEHDWLQAIKELRRERGLR